MKITIFIAITFCMPIFGVELQSSDQIAFVTSNLTFYLSGKTNWSPQSQFQYNELIKWNIVAANTNAAFRTFPYNQAFEFRLFDGTGREVAKTSKGQANSVPFNPPQTMSEVAKLHGHITSESYPLFRAEEMFVLTNRGIYQLEVRMRLWAQVTNHTPDYEVWTHFLKSPSTNTYFGVVVSEPIKVKVVKD